MNWVRIKLRNFFVAVAGRIGSRIVDAENGQVLGRALIIPWRGKIHVIGLKFAVRLVWLPQKRLTYWKQEIGFAVHPPVDFPAKGSTALEEQWDSSERPENENQR